MQESETIKFLLFFVSMMVVMVVLGIKMKRLVENALSAPSPILSLYLEGFDLSNHRGQQDVFETTTRGVLSFGSVFRASLSGRDEGRKGHVLL